MIEHELRRPRSDEEWREFHAIRRKVLFENRGKLEAYDENHPDDAKPGNHPLVLLYHGTMVGVMRLDVTEKMAWLRRVAIREDFQRRGHGRALLQLAEEFARAQGCIEIVSNAAVEAVGFYERCGYERDESASPPSNSIRVRKIIFSDPQSNSYLTHRISDQQK
ncbi:MAG TPA: GNAT family N-acetyltransferase [Pyrinomonadaceae bacterium]|nr:GNAT family N-acetyltransferase [Pyrinomonadaceae bacterium]